MAVIKKKNWSALGPDKIANFRWKRVTALHQGMKNAFPAIVFCEESYPSWFCTGKTTLIPKPGEFCSANQRPITCLNTLYKWFNSCTLGPVDQQQRGAKTGSSGMMDNLLIDQVVMQDCHRGKRYNSMAWIDVKKAYDSVDEWLVEMMDVHRFPR